MLPVARSLSFTLTDCSLNFNFSLMAGGLELLHGFGFGARAIVRSVLLLHGFRAHCRVLSYLIGFTRIRSARYCAFRLIATWVWIRSARYCAFRLIDFAYQGFGWWLTTTVTRIFPFYFDDNDKNTETTWQKQFIDDWKLTEILVVAFFVCASAERSLVWSWWWRFMPRCCLDKDNVLQDL